LTSSQQDDQQRVQRLAQQQQTREFIDSTLTQMFAPQDEALQAAMDAPRANGMPEIAISPLEGRFLQVLALSVGAKRILEIGALGGYSSVWLARALPPGGRLISLELSEKHAAVARASLERAGVGDCAEVRVGPAAQSLPALQGEPPFDLVFIDADKEGYPTYLDWALKLTRPGSLIVADNCIRGGAPLREQPRSPENEALHAYDVRVASDPRLLSVALPVDDGGTDGFAISVVLPADRMGAFNAARGVGG
jgi:caffeoyl-CoA O-methyltransferase